MFRIDIPINRKLGRNNSTRSIRTSAQNANVCSIISSSDRWSLMRVRVRRGNSRQQQTCALTHCCCWKNLGVPHSSPSTRLPPTAAVSTRPLQTSSGSPGRRRGGQKCECHAVLSTAGSSETNVKARRRARRGKHSSWSVGRSTRRPPPRRSTEGWRDWTRIGLVGRKYVAMGRRSPAPPTRDGHVSRGLFL